MFKKSFYNVEIPKKDNKRLIYNTYTGALALLNEEFQCILDNIDSKRELNNDTSQLFQKGFIVEKDLDECQRINIAQNIQKYNTRILDLVISPTLLCNMDCPYCFENKINKTFNDENEKQLLDFIDKNIVNGGELNISWFGGEPLLQKDMIYRLSKQIKLICEEKNIKYEANIVTNGVLLDYETAKYLKEECSVEFAQVTIDGLKETNDKRRYLKNGQSSFDIIIKNIDQIQSFFKIHMRINLDKTNLKESNDLIKFFKEKDWSKNVQYYFAPVQETDSYTESCLSGIETKKAQMELLKQFCEKYSLSFFSKPLFRPALSKCMAARYNSYFINADGDIYKCPNHLNDDSKKIANLKDNTLLTNQHVIWLNTVEHKKMCRKCILLPLCNGGCPKNRLENDQPICEYENLDSFKRIIELYYDEFLNA